MRRFITTRIVAMSIIRITLALMINCTPSSEPSSK